MKISALSNNGQRVVVLEAEARTMLDLWFGLHASLGAEETTSAQRRTIAGCLPALQRALVAAGALTDSTARAFQLHMERKPQGPPLDHIAPFFTKGS
jgi:hypothetical protein